jgi:hypothetical protein
MATKFNPFTGNFDLTGSGGGGASYIDGEVAVFNDLPVTVGTPAVNSAYLVRGAQGVWPVSYKPGGIYVRSGNAGTLADWTYSGVFPDVFSDSQFLIYDDADTSKNAQFSAASISTGTTRTYTLPNANGTLMLNTLNLSSLTDLPTARTNLGLGSGDSPTFTNLTLARGTITTSSPFALTQTWNASGTTFTALDVNVTNTASAAASTPFNIRVSGSTVFNVRRDGVMFSGATQVGVGVSDQVANRIGFYVAGTERVRMDGNSAIFGLSTMSLQWFNNTSVPLGSGASVDLILARDGAGIHAWRNGTNAQTSRLYGTFTDASNGRWLNLGSTTAGRFTISATGNGTGASGNELVLASPVITPAASVSLGTNGDLGIEATSNTSLTFRYRGSDGTTRSASLTLS